MQTGNDIIDGIPHVRTHSADSVERESRSEEGSHRLVGLLALNPDDALAGQALNDRSYDGRVRIVVSILSPWVLG